MFARNARLSLGGPMQNVWHRFSTGIFTAWVLVLTAQTLHGNQNCCQLDIGCGSSTRLRQDRCEQSGGTFHADQKCIVGTGTCGPKITGDIEPECSGVPMDLCCDVTAFEPDFCEVSIEQLDWKDGDDFFLSDGMDSRFGQVTFHYRGLNAIDWGQVIIDGVWVVRNLPLLQLNGPDADEQATTIFDLGVLPGTDVTSANVYATVTDAILSSPPAAPVVTTLPVTDAVRRQGGASIAGGPLTSSPNLSVSPGVFAYHPPLVPPCEWKLRPYMPNMNVKWNHCAPGAVANAIENMKKRTGLPIDQTQQQIYDKLRGEMMTTKNGATQLYPTNKLLEGKIAFLQEKGLDSEITVLSSGPWFGGADFNPMKLHQWMCDGYEVELEYGWVNPNGGWTGGHTVVVAGSIKCGDEICVIVRSDHDQDLVTHQPPDYPDARPEGIDQWDLHCFKEVMNVCHDSARNASAVCASNNDCIGTCSGDYGVNCLADADCAPGNGTCVGRQCVNRWELTNEALNQVRGAIAQCPENVNPVSQPPTWVVDTLASAVSSPTVQWSQGAWTKNGNPIGDTFPGGTLTSGPNPASAGDARQLPVTPNDFHWTVTLPFLGIPYTVRINFKNIPPQGFGLPFQVYVNPAVPDYELTVDWQGNFYTIRDVIQDQVIHQAVWIGGLGYPLNLPPEYQPTSAFRNYLISAQCPCYGDVNADGVLDKRDMLNVLDCSQPETTASCGLADVNCDGNVNTQDADSVLCLMDGGIDCCGCGSCQLFGDIVDVNGQPISDCLVDVSDLLCVLDDFVDPTMCAGNGDLVSADFSCVPDGLIDISDLLSTLNAFSGIYACPHPCAPPGAPVEGPPTPQTTKSTSTRSQPARGTPRHN